MQSVQHLPDQNTNVNFILYRNFIFSKYKCQLYFVSFSFMCKMVTVAEWGFVHYSHLLVGFCPGGFFPAMCKWVSCMLN